MAVVHDRSSRASSSASSSRAASRARAAFFWSGTGVLACPRRLPRPWGAFSRPDGSSHAPGRAGGWERAHRPALERRRVPALAATHTDLAKRLAELEDKTDALALNHDAFSRNTRNQLKQVFDALRELMTRPIRPGGPSASSPTSPRPSPDAPAHRRPRRPQPPSAAKGVAGGSLFVEEDSHAAQGSRGASLSRAGLGLRRPAAVAQGLPCPRRALQPRWQRVDAA